MRLSRWVAPWVVRRPALVAEKPRVRPTIVGL
jgi:hypothetical protein